MSQYKIDPEPGVIYFLTLTVVQWLDIFTKPEYFQIIINSLKHCQRQKNLLVHAYVIMTNHLHLMVSTRKTGSSAGRPASQPVLRPASQPVLLSDIIRDFKSWTAKKIYQQLIEDNRHYLSEILKTYKSSKNKDFQLWQHDNHAITIKSEKFFNQKMDYIHNNPVKKRYVEKPEDWLYSSARNYLLDDYSIIKIDMVE